MVTAWRRYWQNAFNYRGYATVSDYWWIVLWVFIISLPFWIITMYVGVSDVYNSATSSMQGAGNTWSAVFASGSSSFSDSSMTASQAQAATTLSPIHHSLAYYSYLIPQVVFFLPALSIYIRRLNAVGLPYWFNAISGFYCYGAGAIYVLLQTTDPHMLANPATGVTTIPMWVWPNAVFGILIFVCSFIRTRYTVNHPNPSIPVLPNQNQNGPQGPNQNQF